MCWEMYLYCGFSMAAYLYFGWSRALHQPQMLRLHHPLNILQSPFREKYTINKNNKQIQQNTTNKDNIKYTNTMSPVKKNSTQQTTGTVRKRPALMDVAKSRKRMRKLQQNGWNVEILVICTFDTNIHQYQSMLPILALEMNHISSIYKNIVIPESFGLPTPM